MRKGLLAFSTHVFHDADELTGLVFLISVDPNDKAVHSPSVSPVPTSLSINKRASKRYLSPHAGTIPQQR